jgi:hypothetical protein
MTSQVLPLPGHSSVPDHNFQLSGFKRSHANYSRSDRGCVVVGYEPTQGFELLHLLLHPLRFDHRSLAATEHSTALVLPFPWQIPGQDASQDVQPLRQPWRPWMGVIVPEVYKFGSHW